MSIAKDPPSPTTESRPVNEGQEERPPTPAERETMDPLTRLAHENRERLDREAERVAKENA